MKLTLNKIWLGLLLALVLQVFFWPVNWVLVGLVVAGFFANPAQLAWLLFGVGLALDLFLGRRWGGVSL
ncbi:hypothetical protein ACFLZP_04845, partial [Patescibacteria group bacterium]